MEKVKSLRWVINFFTTVDFPAPLGAVITTIFLGGM
jgi:hypothetical protein